MSQKGLRVLTLPCPVPSISLVEPGPVGTAFEEKLLEQASGAQFPGADPDTLHYFRDLYLPASRELFRSLGQSPQAVAQVSGGSKARGRHGGPSLQKRAPGSPAQGPTPQAIVKVISSARPPLRLQTNARYSALTALKAADPSGRLYVWSAHRLLFRWPGLLSRALRCLACGCFPSRVLPG